MLKSKKSSIVRDLQLGKNAEQTIVELFTKLGYFSVLNDDKATRSEYDIHCSPVVTSGLPSFTIEVKHDIYANKSGNIAMEVFNPKSGKPSGLKITTATLWCHIVDKIYCANTKQLQYFVSTTAPKRIITAGGDGNASLYLYDKDLIVDKVFKELDPNDLKITYDTIQDLLAGV